MSIEQTLPELPGGEEHPRLVMVAGGRIKANPGLAPSKARVGLAELEQAY